MSGSAERKRVEEHIREIAGRRKNTTLQEIEWVVNQLALLGWETNKRGTSHNMMFRVGEQQFAVCSHNRGNKQLKRCYVDAFLNAMTELGLYED